MVWISKLHLMRWPPNWRLKRWCAKAIPLARLGHQPPTLLGLPLFRLSTVPVVVDVPVPEDQLPVVLPENVVPDGAGSPLNKMPEFYETTCPKCGGCSATRNRHHGHFHGIKLVFCPLCLRLTDMVDPAAAKYWMAVDQYVGGIEHHDLHLVCTLLHQVDA